MSRLPAPERRAAVVETACRVFAKSSYHGSTTAQIARESGVTEPVLYRHFASKRELYLVCLGVAWERLRALWEKALEPVGVGRHARADVPASASDGSRDRRRPLDPGTHGGGGRP